MAGVEVLALVGDDLDRMGDAYVAVATAGAATTARLVEEWSVEAIILGSTDLSIAFEAGDIVCPVIDSAVVHATAIADAAW